MRRPLRSLALAGIASLAVAGLAALLFACGGSSSSPGNPSSPSTNSMAPMTITIVGIAGNQSFSPASPQVAAGQQVVFHNADTVNHHHIVQDAGGWDTGDLAPGQTSGPVTVSSTAAQTYHCVIHPTMVGGINGASTMNPPCTGAYCG
jgi:plastocyanin